MADIAADAPTRSRAAEGILCMVIGMAIFVVQDAMMKALLEEVTLWTLMAARGLLGILVLTPLILFLGRPHRLLTPLWPTHLLRALLFAVGFSLFFTAFPFLGFAEVTTIFFAAPLFTALFAALFLGERVGVYRIGALAVGFVGVLIAMNPTGETFQWVAVLPLCTAVSYALAQVLARRVGDRESSLTFGLFTLAPLVAIMPALAYGVTSLIDVGPDFQHLRWDWSVPSDHLGLVALLAALGLVGYIFLTRAYQVAEASIIAPFDYVYLPFAALLAFAVWEETPAWNTLVGMVVIIGSGLFIGYRELLQQRRAAPAPTAEVAFSPSAPIGDIVHAVDAGSQTEPAQR